MSYAAQWALETKDPPKITLEGLAEVSRWVRLLDRSIHDLRTPEGVTAAAGWLEENGHLPDCMSRTACEILIGLVIAANFDTEAAAQSLGDFMAAKEYDPQKPGKPGERPTCPRCGLKEMDRDPGNNRWKCPRCGTSRPPGPDN